MKYKYLLFLLLYMPMLPCTQSVVTLDTAPKKITKLYEKAEKCFEKQRYEEGIEKLQRTIEAEPLFLDAYIKVGGVFYRQKKFEQSIKYYDIAYSLDTTNAKIAQALAINHEQLGNYDKAINYYTIYLQNAKRIKPSYQLELEKKIADFSFREKAMDNPSPFDPEILSDAINTTQFSEYLPSLTADGKRIFFTRVTRNQEDIWYSEKDSTGKWGQAVMLPNLNTEENEGAHTISADGKTILFTYCSQSSESMLYRGCNIYASFLRSGRWTKPAFFTAINSKAWDTQPNISADGNQIIFVSKRAGGHGASDLWWSKRNTEGKWTTPENLGPVINTSLREESPFFHADGKTLYFKSEGHPGMGSFDLFKSELQIDGGWSIPENLGYPINTEEHEGAMVIALDGRTAYYSRGDGEVKFDKRGSDLYSFELPESMRAAPVGFVNFRVYDSKTRAPLKANVVVRTSEDDVRVLNTDGDGEALVLIPLGDDYSVNIDLENYYFHSERFELTDINTAETAYEVIVGLRKIEEAVNEEPIVLRNVLFETGSYALKDESHYELDKLAGLLIENEALKIEIRGHTDDVGDPVDNQLLSENRAMAVYEYLVAEGINADRMSYIGLGETVPISSNDTEVGRKMNRRTEFITKN